jgi:hypothetical protein
MKTLLWGAILAGMALSAVGSNFSGKWAIQNPPGRFGRGGVTILTLNQVGTEVSGTIGGRVEAATGSPVNTEILGGKVEGDVLSFYVWRGQDQPVKVTYRGTMAASGEEISFTITGLPRPAFGGTPSQETAEQKVTAKRSK